VLRFDSEVRFVREWLELRKPSTLADNSTSDLAGTPLYLAPEILGGCEATVQSDIYSLGVLLYYLVTGSYPVHARSLGDISLAHERNERSRPSKKAVASIRRNIRRRLWRGNQAPWDEVARDLNRTVRGWAGYFSYGSVAKVRNDVTLHLYHAVRRFLRRRHKIAGSGYRQFPAQDVFGKLGVLSPASYSRFVFAHAFP
jgi:serine/threonine protein kinase